ncbi:ubiquitin carboxyl-terminal hydrolase [Anaeramoeba ignava]|uniref:Ubiquitin carboxyl-terminal hydrolase n=1 Tax=Anaeramoeba ignava TaxID=1746090 RepID=A0A9Q0LS25_ANAIG|nr:ubiquitin carboxyl-terminal hydrolase [Anaeramoeba ignava]
MQKIEEKQGRFVNVDGNCYMNSSLQCLIRTKPLSFFIENYIPKDIEPENLTESLVIEYSNIVSNILSSEGKTVSGKKLKEIFGKLVPSFDGDSQQDGQEFLSFFLDYFSEGIESLKKRGKLKEKLKENSELAKNSLIEELFNGTIRTQIFCPECQSELELIDPYLWVTLSLSDITSWDFSIIVVFKDKNKKPTQYWVKSQKEFGLQDLLLELSIQSQINFNSLLLVEVNNHEIYQVITESNQLNSVTNQDYLVAYEIFIDDPNQSVTEKYIQDPSKWIQIIQKKTVKRKFGNLFFDFEIKFGFPFLIYFSETVEKDYQKGITTIIDDFNDKNTKIEITKKSKINIIWNSNISTNIVDESKEIIESSSYKLFKSTNQKKKDFTLENCIEEFLETETLSNNQGWRCSFCGKSVQAVKMIQFFELPKILVFHLKRFAIQESSISKIQSFIKFPIKLQLNSIQNENFLYEIYAVLNHHGTSFNGHYTCYCKGDEGKWFHFDDEKVNYVNEESIITSASYMLFYKRI